MINIIAFPNDTHFLTVISTLSSALLAGEAISYPFERIHTKMIARQYPKTGFLAQAAEILRAESIGGLFRGFNISVGNAFTRSFVQYYLFNILYNQSAYRHIINIKQAPKENKNIDLKYIDLRYWKTHLCILGAVSLSNLIIEPKKILQMKIQGDALGHPRIRQNQHIEEITKYHGRTILRAGYMRRVIYEMAKFNGEIMAMQYLLISNDYIFKNLHNGAKGNSDAFLPVLFAGLTSGLVNLAFYPLNIIHRRAAIRRLRSLRHLYLPQHVIHELYQGGYSSMYRGLSAYLMRSIPRSMIQFGLLWQLVWKLKSEQLLEQY